ncbi:MAG: T9SS type A sorting domain-containing protein [Rhodothermaceae bacterium]|nr:T9SS type A sorting domain-containing protein [Rhodothermaceae bacterium]
MTAKRIPYTNIIAVGMSVLIILVFLGQSIKQDSLRDQQEHSAISYPAKKARADYFHRMLKDPATGEIPKGIRKKELAYAATLPGHSKAHKAASRSNISWTEAGPNNVGGRTRALAVDRTNSNTVLAGGVAGGIWKSTDRGNSWELTSDPTQLITITHLSQDPREAHTSTWYAVTGEFNGSSNVDRGIRAPRYGEGLYMSTDNGDSWTLIESSRNPTLLDSPFDIGLKVLASPTTGSIFTASQAFGIQRLQTPASEREWVLGTESLPRWSDFDIASDGSIIAVTSIGVTPSPTDVPGVFYSTDNGDRWQSITPPGFPGAPERSVIAFAPSDPGLAYLWTFTGETVPSTTSSFGQDEVMKFYVITLPSGASEDRSAFLPMFGRGFGDLYTQSSYDMVLAVNPNDPNDVFIGGTNLYRSRDGFSTALDNNDIAKTWVGGYAIANNGDEYLRHHPDQHALFFDPLEAGVLWSGHDGGLSMALNIDSTTNLIDWKDKNNGYNVTQFYHVSLPPEAGDDRIIGGTQDNGTHFLRFDPSIATGTESIQRLTGGDGGYTYLGSDYGLSSTQMGQLFELRYNSFTGSILLANALPIQPTGASNQLFINPFAVDKTSESVVYYPAGGELWRGGNIPGAPGSWSRLSNVSIPSGYSISALETGIRDIGQQSTSVLYFAASGSDRAPALFRLDEASTSTEAPVNISLFDLPIDAYIHNIAVNPLDGNELLVIASNYNIVGMYHSIDGGASFSPVEGNLTGDAELPGPSLRAATILPVNGTLLYIVGTSTGVYSTSFLNGQNTEWVQEASSEIGNTVVESVTSRTVDQRIAVGTHGRGIFVGLPLPTVSIDDPPTAPSLAGAALAQNYPNPFRLNTTLTFSLREAGRVTLRVFDPLGRHVKTLVRQKLYNQGTYSLPFNSGTLPSGTYIYALEVHPSRSASQVFREQKLMVLH